MTASPITIADLAVLASIGAVVLPLTTAAIKALIAYLTAKLGGPQRMTVAEQSAQCRFDHSEINKLITVQNANIAKMLEQNGEQIKALSDANHAAQLRHQIVISQFEKTHDKMASLHALVEKR